jgi:hypothetical protein
MWNIDGNSKDGKLGGNFLIELHIFLKKNKVFTSK